MSAYKRNIYISNLWHFRSHPPYVYNKMNVFYFLTCFLFWGKAHYLSGWKLRLPSLTRLSHLSRIAPDPPFITGLQGQKVAKLSLQLGVSDPWVQWDRCWKRYKRSAQSRRKIWKPTEANGHLSAAFSEPKNWGSKLSVDRRGVFTLYLLPLNCHSWFKASCMEQPWMAYCEFILGACRRFKCGISRSPQVNVVSVDEAFCALLALLVTKTPRSHGSNLQESSHWLDRLNSTNILWFASYAV